MAKTILITGAGSGFGEGTAIGLAKKGYSVIAGVQISQQVTELRNKAVELGIQDNLRVEKLDILDNYDVSRALKWDADILLSNAGYGEAGPIFEIPVDLVRKNFETNVFAPLYIIQRFAAKLISEKKEGKIVIVSSIAGLITPVGFASYSATKFALEAVADALYKELKPYNIKVQTINPGGYFTGFNDRMAETALRWLEDDNNFTSREEFLKQADSIVSGQLDPQEMIDEMVDIVPAEQGKYRNVVPESMIDFLKAYEDKAWDKTI